LLVGSKLYEYDKENIKARLEQWGYNDITGIDLFEGEGVDFKVDITETGNDFIEKHQTYFSTIICMEVLTNVKNPFIAASNVISMLRREGTVILSECYVRKISKMPVDLWRFTYDGTKQLFSDLKFDDSRVRVSYTREKVVSLMPLSYPFPEILLSRNKEESSLGFLLRRLHRKYFGGRIFQLSRLLPELTIYSIAKKIKE
jgi:hypothetical protein